MVDASKVDVPAAEAVDEDREPLGYGHRPVVPPWLRLVCGAGLVIATANFLISVGNIVVFSNAWGTGSGPVISFDLASLFSDLPGIVTFVEGIFLLIALLGCFLIVAGLSDRTWTAVAGFAGIAVMRVVSHVLYLQHLIDADAHWISWVSSFAWLLEAITIHCLLVALLAPPLRRRLGLA